MERQAFTVLPPLSPRLPPPPATPVSSRIAPRSVAHRDNSAFIILAELGDNGPSGRSSPFRGRGFRAPSPQNSRIPVPSGKSAPSSPVKKKSNITNGKSAPSSPSKKPPVGGPPVPKKRQESPSKLPVTKGSSPQSTPTKETQKRITGKPPIPRHTTTKSNQSKAPQPARRSDHSGRPMPTARTRLNNKPISTNNLRFINTRSENRNASGTSDALVAAKNTIDKENITSNEDNANQEKVENLTECDVQPDTGDKNSSETTADEKNALNVNEVLPPTESKTDTVYGNQVSEVSPNTNDELAEIHKLSIEINSESGNKSEDIKESVVIAKEITNQSSSQKEGTNSEKKSETQLQDGNVALQPIKEIEQLADGDQKTELTNGTKGISDIQVNSVNNELGGTGKVKETVVDVGDEIIQEASKATTKVEVELNEKVPDKDATLVEWTTKQPIELAQPQPDVIPTEPAVGSIEEKEETVQGPPEVEVEAGNHTVTFRSPEIHPVSPRGPKGDAALWGRFRQRVFACCRRDKNKNIKVKPSKSAVDKKNDDRPSIFARLCKWRRKEPPPPRLDKPAIETERIKPKSTTRKWDCFSKVNCCKKCKRKGGAVNPEPSNQSRLQTGKWWRRLFCLDRACCAKCKRKKGLTHGASIKKKEKPRAQSVSGLPKLEPSLVEHSSVMKGSVPVLPICLAWFCLFLNVFLPGTGTITSGFLCMCFGKPRFSVNDSAIARMGAFCVNFIVGISQIFTIIFCLVGWGWSIWWGVMMVRLSRKNRRIKLAEKAAGSQAPVVNQNHDLERGN